MHRCGGCGERITADDPFCCPECFEEFVLALPPAVARVYLHRPAVYELYRVYYAPSSEYLGRWWVDTMTPGMVASLNDLFEGRDDLCSTTIPHMTRVEERGTPRVATVWSPQHQTGPVLRMEWLKSWVDSDNLSDVFLSRQASSGWQEIDG